ncbi:MAG: T9SS type A sorting domain-containing protein [Paludibacteraceae bacterium]
MKTIILFLLVSANCFSQQLYRQMFSGGYAASVNAKSLVGEAFNRVHSEGSVTVGESILYQMTMLDIVSIDEINHQNVALKVYPNPVENELFVQHPEGTNWQVQIYDATGKYITTLPVNQSSVNMNFLSSGIHYLVFNNKDKSVAITKKILKK